MSDLQQLRQMIADDALAMTFQTMGQYRTALLAAISRLEAAAVPEENDLTLAYMKGFSDGKAERPAVPELSREDVVRLAREAGFSMGNSAAVQAAQRFASLVRSVPVGEKS